MALLKSRTPVVDADRAVAVAEVRARIDQLARVTRVCGSCGVEFDGRLNDRGEQRVTLAGETVTYADCPDCAGRSGDVWPVALVLGVEVDDRALDGLTAVRFCDVVWANPERPNVRAWDHLDVTDLAQRFLANRADLARRTGGPCRFCGTTLTNDGAGWWVLPRGGVACWSCDSKLEPRDQWWDEVAAQCHASGVLCGIPAEHMQALPRTFAEAVGFKWFDVSGAEGHEDSWHFLDLDRMRRRAVKVLTEMRWRQVASYRPELVCEVMW